MLGVSDVDGVLFTCAREVFAPELAHGLEHSEAWLAALVRYLPQQALLNQPFQSGEDVEVAGRVGDRLHCFEGAPPAKTASRRKRI